MSAQGRGRTKKSSGGRDGLLEPSPSSSSTTTGIKRAAGFETDDSDDNNETVKPLIPQHPAPAGQSGQLKAWKDFAVTGKLDNFPLMVINIVDYGPLTFPIYSQKIVEELTPFLVKSDYSVDGGKKRIYDPSFRKSYEIHTSQFRFNNPNWAQYVKDTILPKVGGELGFNHSTTRADLRKLLIYEKGSFFTAHTDVVQAPGHFGTLIIQLPSQYSGGQLKCSYGRLEKLFDHSSYTEIDVTVYGPGGETMVLTMDVNPSDTFKVVKSKIENQSKDWIPRTQERYLLCSDDFNSRIVRDNDFIADIDLEMPLQSPGKDLCGFYMAFYLDVQHEVEKVTSGFRSCLVYNLIDTTTTTTTTNLQYSPILSINKKPSLYLEVYQESVGD